MAKEKPIIQQIKERKWIGHALRKDSQATERQVLNWNPQGRRKKGRPKRTWRRTIEEDIGKVGKTWKEIEPWLKTGSAEDAMWKPYAPKGVKGNKPNLNNVRCAIGRHFKNKRMEYLKDKINELATNSKKKNVRDLYRGINECKRGYQPQSNLVKYENGDLLADSHNILNRWNNYFSQLLIVHIVRNVRQIEVHTAEPLVRGLSPSEVEIAIAKLKRYKLPSSDQIPAD
jgi:hypothetical protein